MRYSYQRVITASTGRINLADESVYLRGSESQTVGVDSSRAAAASPGASFRLINDSDHEARFVPTDAGVCDEGVTP